MCNNFSALLVAWALRDYGIEPTIWDGDRKCGHEWGSSIPPRMSKSGKPGPSAHISKKAQIGQDSARRGTGTNFCRKCNAWRGSLGLEPDFNLFIKHLCDLFDLIKPKLKKSGTIWVNLGDTYFAQQGKGFPGTGQVNIPESSKNACLNMERPKGIPAKCLIQIPFRFSIEMVNRGWILRNVIIWQKPNCMPQSAKDRFTVDFEYIFLFSKAKKYYFERQFEGHNVYETTVKPEHKRFGGNSVIGSPATREEREIRTVGRNKRCIWKIPTMPSSDSHFATFPEALIQPMIKAGCPELVCKKCGKPRETIYEIVGRQVTDAMKIAGCTKSGDYFGSESKEYEGTGSQMPSETKRRILESMSHIRKVKGYTDCGCDIGFHPGICLDPFIGSGTTALVARKLGRDFVGIEISKEYVEMANKRIKGWVEQQRLVDFHD